MSLKGVVEFAIHIDGFRNIDLFHQGLYQVRICLYHEKDGQKVFAHPYHTSEKPLKDSKKKDNKPIIGAHILDETSSYVTRTFLIRFCDEETDFNEVCHFRTEYDAFPELAETNFYIEAELMFADLAKLSQPKNGQEDTLASFKCISLFKAKLNNIQAGVHEYLPILFDDNHFCLLHTVFHAVLMDLKFRTSPIEVPREQPPVNGQDKRPPVVYIPPAKNFAEFLQRNTQNFKPHELDKFHNYYIKALRRSYEKLVEFHAYILKICLLGKNKQDYLKFYEKSPFFAIVEPYIGQNAVANKVHSIFSDLKEEVKIPEKPKQLFDGVPEKKISDELNPSDPGSISHNIMQEVNVIAGNIFQTWYLLMDMMQEAPKFIINLLKEEYHKQLKDRWGESIFQQTYKVQDLAVSFEQKVGESHKQIATARRNNLYYKVLDLYRAIEDINMFPKPEFHPILFEEVYVKEILGQKSAETLLAETENNLVKNEYRGVHLIVFSHGFQGNSFDLRLFKNNISYLYPDTLFLCASANEDLTDGEIVGMGLRLANEVKNYIEEWVPGNNLGRLSFIGHSLGGLIIRSALPHLEQFAPKMHLFMTLSSPHLGYMYNSSKIIDAGMWFLKKWKKSTCLQELTMTDSPNMEDTYLFKLSKNKGLEWFKVVVLLSSYQDMYAPFESARIQTSKKATQESTRGSVWANMAKNILSNITTDCVYRIDINFKLEEKNLDTMIGRAAHIKFLESQALMRMMTYRYANFFS